MNQELKSNVYPITRRLHRSHPRNVVTYYTYGPSNYRPPSEANHDRVGRSCTPSGAIDRAVVRVTLGDFDRAVVYSHTGRVLADVKYVSTLKGVTVYLGRGVRK